MNPEQFGDYLKSLRKSKNLTLIELGEKTGMSQPYLSQIENNQRKKLLSPSLLKRLSDALDVDYAELLRKAGYDFVEELTERHPDSFGLYLKQLRMKSGMTTRELGEMAGLSNSYISNVENGKRGTPSLISLKGLAESLNVEYAEMLKEAGYDFLVEPSNGEHINIKKKSKFEIDIHELVGQLEQTLVKKNADYGDSFYKSYEKFGDVMALIRLTDKLNRYETLISGEQKVNDESIDDTLMDLAGYAILTIRSRIEKEMSGNGDDK